MEKLIAFLVSFWISFTFLKVSYEEKYAWISYALHVEYACMQVKTYLLYGVGLSLACG